MLVRRGQHPSEDAIRRASNAGGGGGGASEAGGVRPTPLRSPAAASLQRSAAPAAPLSLPGTVSGGAEAARRRSSANAAALVGGQKGAGDARLRASRASFGRALWRLERGLPPLPAGLAGGGDEDEGAGWDNFDNDLEAGGSS